MSKQHFFEWQDQDLILYLVIQTKAAKDEVSGILQGRLKIRITAQPIENQANLHLQKWLSKSFKVAKNDVILEKGSQCKQKQFRIINPKHIPSWLDEHQSIYPQQMIFRVGAERSRRRSVHKVHDCDENREGNNPENSAVKDIHK
ncbi:MAG: DUF167 family protein [Gammaproteobacteria bacterium]